MGFLMTETAVGIRCAGKRPGMEERMEWCLLPEPASVQHLEERSQKLCTQGYCPPVISHVLMGRSRVGIEVTGDQIVTATRELPNMGQENKDKDSSNVIGAVTKKVQGTGITEEHGARIGVS